MDSPIGARMTIDGREVDYFCGTSYHALHGDQRVIAAACEATRAYGIGPGTLADMPVYQEVIDRVRAYFAVEAASYFASGYVTALIMLQALSDEFDLILVDEASHYSVRDAVAVIGKPVVAFRHRDPEDLIEKLKRNTGPGQVPVVVTDGVFPTTGRLAPLDVYAEILESYDRALLCVDDSHGVGVLGANGRGTFEHFGVDGPGLYSAGTLSKAFGGFGGIIPGSAALIGKIKRGVKLIEGASLPPVPGAVAGSMGLKLLSEHPEMRQRLADNVKHMRTGLRQLGFDVDDAPTPIVHVTADIDLTALCEKLAERDIAIRRVAPSGYSDAPDVEALRIAVFSTHDHAQIDRLIANLREFA